MGIRQATAACQNRIVSPIPWLLGCRVAIMSPRVVVGETIRGLRHCLCMSDSRRICYCDSPYEQVVGRKEVLEILSNYTYTIDYISDANGKPETFGPEAGYGIISGSEILSWVRQNCAVSCPGDVSRPMFMPCPACCALLASVGDDVRSPLCSCGYCCSHVAN